MTRTIQEFAAEVEREMTKEIKLRYEAADEAKGDEKIMHREIAQALDRVAERLAGLVTAPLVGERKDTTVAISGAGSVGKIHG